MEIPPLLKLEDLVGIAERKQEEVREACDKERSFAELYRRLDEGAQRFEEELEGLDLLLRLLEECIGYPAENIQRWREERGSVGQAYDELCEAARRLSLQNISKGAFRIFNKGSSLKYRLEGVVKEVKDRLCARLRSLLSDPYLVDRRGSIKALEEGLRKRVEEVLSGSRRSISDLITELEDLEREREERMRDLSQSERAVMNALRKLGLSDVELDGLAQEVRLAVDEILSACFKLHKRGLLRIKVALYG